MIELAVALRTEDWMAGFFDRPHERTTLKRRWQALEQWIAHGNDKGMLIVMDYVEGRQEEVRGVAERLSRHPEDDIAAAINPSAFNLSNAIGAWTGGMAIATGYGWSSTGLVGAALAAGGPIAMAFSTLLSKRTARAAE